MLSYRHAFHAGNFADVLKHSLLLHTLSYMTQKDKPLRVIETHAGAGAYKLSSATALKTREFENGIGALWDKNDLPPLLLDYVDAVKQFNTTGKLVNYPGSPLFIRSQLRPFDNAFLHELHSADWRLLQDAVGAQKNIKMFDVDGLAALQALVPPPDRRALVFIDPSYEVKSEYQEVIKQVTQAYKRFATGTYVIWYPVVLRERIDHMERQLKKSGIKNIQLFEFGIAPDSNEYGMNSAGLFVINPPWTLWAAMEQALPYLVSNLSENEQGFYRLEQLVSE